VAPPIEVGSTVVAEPTAAAFLSAPAGEEVVDELLASEMLRHPAFQAAVEEWVEYWGVTAAPWFPDFVRRMGHYAPTVEAALADNDLPASLRYLPFIESGYSPGARSSAAAVGLWQFMEGTAGGLGLQVTLRGIFYDRHDGFAPDPRTCLQVLQSSVPIGRLTRLDGFFVLDIGNAFITLAWENILNTSYFTVPTYPMPDRRFSLGLRWQFRD